MEQPAWVSEGSIRKYHRALAQLTKENKPITEEAVKELYVKWSGKVLDVAAPEVVADEATALAPAKKKAK